MGDYYVPGIGIAVTFSVVFLTGFLASNFLTARIVRFFTLQFEKVPFIKTIYSPLKDLMSLFSGRQSKDMKKVVAVKLDGSKIETLGLVTREDFRDLNEDSFTADKIAVYIPLSYMIGGITVIVGRESVRELNIPVDRAFRLAITGWIKHEEDDG